MKSRLQAAAPLLWLGGIVMVGLVLVALVRNGSSPAPVEAEQANDGVAAASTQAGPGVTDTAPTTAATETPPWMGAGATGPQYPTAASRALSAPGQRAPVPGQVAQAVAQIREQAARNEHNADELLRQIDTMKASGQVPPGVNLDAVRNNLLVAKRAQSLAREMAELTQQADAPARQQRIADITRELQQLQSQLRYDVSAPGAAAAATAPPGGSR
jgi:hypothetical protein